jgi:uncharacterized protein YjbI with pentapeptide repeats
MADASDLDASAILALPHMQEAIQAREQHLAKFVEGVAAWNQWRLENPRVHPRLGGANFSFSDLRTVNLSGADLSSVFFYQANLVGANLAGAQLIRANLSSSDLSGADLHRAEIVETNFSWVNLSRAKLNKAKLNTVNLYAATLYETDLSHAMLGTSSFVDVDLSHARGLETVRHMGPSGIGIDTLYKSKGQIPDSFLRGAGVPEQFIAYARSLVGQAIEFYSCFISYSSEDQEFAERLHADLRAKNLRVWFAPEDLKIGDRFQERIEESIQLYDKVMIVLSDASVKSRWVEREVNAAREREDRENRTVLFPIRMDGAVMHATAPWAADLRRQRHMGDFTKWKDHDSYQKALERLLRDLKADTKTAL